MAAIAVESPNKHAQLIARDGKITRDALLKVALRHYLVSGYEATSLRKITQELGITVAAIYYHFASKDELLVAAFRRNLMCLQTAHDLVGVALSSSERLWTFVQLHTRLQRSDDVVGRQLYSASLLRHSLPPTFVEPLSAIMRSIRDRLRNIIAQGIREKSFCKVDVTATAYAIFGMSHQLNTWYRPDGALDLDKLAAIYADFALRLVGAEPVKNRARLQQLTASALAEARGAEE
jgi:AcrR family transcriptional regulator